MALLRTIIDEAHHGQRFTCILYPTPDSMLLPDFVAAARSFETHTATAASSTQDTAEDTEPAGARKQPINLVVLDGTYSHARRQLRHLEAMLTQFNQTQAAADDDAQSGNPPVPVKLPVVKLLLSEDGE